MKILRTMIVAMSLFASMQVALADESSLEKDLANAETGRSASELIKLCTSADPDRLTYCEGYIDGAMHIWKYITACQSPTISDQSFCAGVKFAEKVNLEAFSACRDCNFGSFRPELGDKPIRLQLYKERMREFSKALRATLGICSPDERRDEHYCSGYNAQVANTLAEDLLTYPNIVPKGVRDLGLGHAAGDVGIHAFASEEFFEFRPCIQTAIGPQQARKIFLEFMRDNPEQQRSTAIMAMAKALFYSVCPGPEEGLRPHMEQCTTWEYDDDNFGTENTCDKAVVIQFMVKDQPAIERQLKPGETFRTGLSRSQTIGWMFTTCPVGYVSSVPFLPEEDDAFIDPSPIKASLYSCVRK